MAAGATVNLWGLTNTGLLNPPPDYIGCVAGSTTQCAMVCGLLLDTQEISTVYVTSHGLDDFGNPTTNAACYPAPQVTPPTPTPVAPWDMPNALLARHQASATALAPLRDAIPPIPSPKYDIRYYVIGGIGSCPMMGPGGTCGSVEQFDFHSNAWSILLTDPMPFPVAGAGVTYAMNPPRILVFGGRQCDTQGACTPLPVVQQLNLVTNKWSLVPAAMKEARSDFAIIGDCDQVGSLIYGTPYYVWIFGGHDGNGRIPDAEVYDCAANTFTVLPDMPMPASNSIAMRQNIATSEIVAPTGDFVICVVGGINDVGQQIDAIQRYDRTTNTWLRTTPDPLARSWLSQSTTGWHTWHEDRLGFRVSKANDPLAMIAPCNAIEPPYCQDLLPSCCPGEYLENSVLEQTDLWPFISQADPCIEDRASDHQTGAGIKQVCPCVGHQKHGSVDIVTGEFRSTVAPVSIPSAYGMDFEVNMTYRSQHVCTGPVAPWCLNLASNLKQLSNGDIIRQMWSGEKVRYALVNGEYQSPYGYFDELTSVTISGVLHYQILGAHGDVEVYHYTGKLAYLQDRNGNRISLRYDSDLRLIEAEDTHERLIFFKYASSSPTAKLTQIIDFADRVTNIQTGTGTTLLDITTPASHADNDDFEAQWEPQDPVVPTILENWPNVVVMYDDANENSLYDDADKVFLADGITSGSDWYQIHGPQANSPVARPQPPASPDPHDADSLVQLSGSWKWYDSDLDAEWSFGDLMYYCTSPVAVGCIRMGNVGRDSFGEIVQTGDLDVSKTLLAPTSNTPQYVTRVGDDVYLTVDPGLNGPSSNQKDEVHENDIRLVRAYTERRMRPGNQVERFYNPGADPLPFAAHHTTYTWTNIGADPVAASWRLDITDPEGQVYSKTRFMKPQLLMPPGRVLDQYQGDGLWKYFYNDVEHTTTVQDPVGNVVDYVWDSQERPVVLVKVEYSNRHIRPSPCNWPFSLVETLVASNYCTQTYVTKYTYNRDLLRTSVEYPKGNRVVWVYDEANSEVRAHGNALYEIRQIGPVLDPAGLNPAQNTTRKFTYTPDYNFVESSTDPRGMDPAFIPQNKGLTSPERYTTRYQYDVKGNLLSIVQPTVNPYGLPNPLFTTQLDGQQASTTNTYNAQGQSLTQVDAAGISTSYTYYGANSMKWNPGDRAGYLKKQASGTTETEYTWMPIGGVATITDPKDQVYEIDSDGRCLILEVKTPQEGVESEKRYDGNDQIVSSSQLIKQYHKYLGKANKYEDSPDTDPLAHGEMKIWKVDTTEYDAMGRVVKTTQDAAPFADIVTRNVYDLAGQLVLRYNPNAQGAVEPHNVEAWIKDERGLPYQSMIGGVTDRFLEVNPFLVGTTWAGYTLGPTPEMAVTENWFDLNGNPTHDVDALGNITAYGSDGFDRATLRVDALGTCYQSVYDPAGNQVDSRTIAAPNITIPVMQQLQGTPWRGAHCIVAAGSCLGPVGCVLLPPSGDLINNSPGPVLCPTCNPQTKIDFGCPTDPIDQSVPLDVSSLLVPVESPVFSLWSRIIKCYDERSRLWSENQAFFNPATGASFHDGPASPGDGYSTTLHELDEFSREIRLTNDNAHVSKTQYDSLGRVVKTTDAIGSYTETTYDANGNVIKTETHEDGDLGTATYTVETEVDAANRPTQTTRPGGGWTETVSDGLGNTVRSMNSKLEGKRTYFDHHSRQYAQAFLDLKTFEAYVRDSNDAPLWVGQSFTTSGFATGEKPAILERTCYTSHDDACLGFDVPAHEDVWLSVEYPDEDHELISLDWWAVPFYTVAGADYGKECTSSLCPGVSRVHYSTGSGSLPADTSTVAWQPMTAFVVLGPYGIKTSLEYDSNGNVVSQTDGLGKVTETDFDALNRKTKVTYADANHDDYAYNAAGQVTSMVDANGNAATNTFDALGRLLNVDVTIPGTSPTIGTTEQEFQYDPLGRRVLAKDITGTTIQFTTSHFDSLGNVLQESQNGIAVESVRDGLGFREVLKLPNGAEFYSEADALERLKRIRDGSATGPLLTTYLYQGSSRLVGRDDGNGINSRFTYNADGVLSGIKHKFGTGASDPIRAGWTYAMDVENQRTSMTDLVNAAYSATSYTMDRYERLIGFERSGYEETWDLDAANNWQEYEKDVSGTVTTETRTHDSTHFLTARTGAAASTRDAAGNLKDDGTYTYHWDFKNRLREVRNKASGTLRAEYFYDADYRRLMKIDYSGANAKTTRYVLDGNREVVEESWTAPATAATESRTYVYGLHVDEIVVMQVRNEIGGVPSTTSTNWYHQDDIDSLRLITDDAGATDDEYAYDPYGKMHHLSGTSDESRRFTGRNHDEESGFDYYRSRYYASALGRFVNRDSVGIWGDAMNLGNGYGYLASNPTIGNDPSGKIMAFIAGYPGNQIHCDDLTDLVGLGVCGGSAVAPYIAGQTGDASHNSRASLEDYWEPIRADIAMQQLAQVGKLGMNRAMPVYDWAQDPEAIAKDIIRLQLDSKTPLIIVGHSYGATTALEVIKAINDMNNPNVKCVDLSILLDKVSMVRNPSTSSWSSNVQVGANIYARSYPDFVPSDLSVHGEGDGGFVNWGIDSNHSDIVADALATVHIMAGFANTSNACGYV